VRAAGGGRSRRSHRRRVARRTSIVSRAYWTMRATGVSRSSTINVRPFLTDLRCSFNRDLSSAIRTVVITGIMFATSYVRERETPSLPERVTSAVN
jgi:hypothetical protein